MEIGIDSFAAMLPDPATGKLPSGTDRMADLIAEVEVADRAAYYAHHPEYSDVVGNPNRLGEMT